MFAGMDTIVGILPETHSGCGQRGCDKFAALSGISCLSEQKGRMGACLED